MMRASLLPLLSIALVASLCLASRAAADDAADARKAFAQAMRSEEVTVRRDGWLELAYADGEKSVDVGLKALKKETSELVILTAVEVFGAYRDARARAALRAAAKRARGDVALYALLALGAAPTDEDKALLLNLLDAKDDVIACQAALVLAPRGDAALRDRLVALLTHKSRHRRAAAARGLRILATGALRAKDAAEVDLKDAMRPLVDALGRAKGRERSDHVAALEAISGQRYGLDRAAWEQLAGGVAPAQIQARTIREAHVFGIPIRGERVVLVLTNSQRNENPIPFDIDRLKALCQIPGAPPILSSRLLTVGQFARAHAKRLISDLPSKGMKFDLVWFHEMVQPVFGKLTPLNAGTKKKLATSIDETQPDARMNHYGALMAALDIAGTKDNVAMKSGPDEIIFVACNVPNHGDLKEPAQIAAAVALKARRRMVTIHTIGIETHAYEMMRAIARDTGGTYVDLHK